MLRAIPVAVIVILLLAFDSTGCTDRRAAKPADPYAEEVAGLVTAVSHQRPIEGRLAGGFQYGEWKDVRGADRDLQVLAAGARLQQAGAEPHAKGVAALLNGDTDQAVTLLEGLLARPGWSAGVASDLAAARLARWRRTGLALDAVRALNEAGRAIARDPNLPEAWFNRALALDAMQLAGPGQDAWRRYVQIDPEGPWSAEAAQRGERDGASRQQGTLAGPSARVAREHFETDLLREWSDAHRTADHPARLRDALRTQGTALATARGDLQWQRIGEELEAVPPARQPRVAKAVQDLLRARAAIDANRFDSAVPLLDSLPVRLAGVPSLARTARFWIQYVAWHRGDRSATIAPLSRLQEEAARQRFGYLEARCALLLAASWESLARYDEASVAFRAAIEKFESLGEVEFAASAHAMLAQLLALQGDLAEAWDQQRAALEALRWIDAPRPRIVVLANAVVIAAHYGFPFAALDIQDAQLADTRRWGDPGALVRYFVERARLANDLQMTGMAQSALREGEGALAAIADASNRRIFETDLAIEAARVGTATDPAGAARTLADVAARMKAAAGEFKLAEVYLDLGQAKLQSGDRDGALQAWMTGIDVFERQRRAIAGEALRITFYSRAWNLYESAVGQLVRQQAVAPALSLVERSRARALRDGLLPETSVPDLGAIQSRLPEKTLLLTFASQREALLIWAIDRSAITFGTVPWSAQDLHERIEEARHEVLNGEPGAAADRVSAAIIGPFAARLASAERLVIVPDGDLGGLPFAALRLPGQAQMLIDRLAVTYAPSLTVFDTASRRLTALGATPPRSAIFLGDPEIDRSAYPSLNRLPSARTEILDSARSYPVHREFLGSEATAAALTGALGAADVVHFAGHAIADAEFPLRATLTVAPARGRPGFVRAADLASTSAGRTRVVVLSACSTANAAATFGEGPLSLARPFLAAGVPSLVGTLWDVDDGDAAALVPIFHRGLRAGLPPDEALRRAQLALRASPDLRVRRPRAWSGFVVIGGSGPAARAGRGGKPVI